MKRNLLGLVAAALLGLFATQARAESFISGFLAQCTAIGNGTCTEQTATGYARQPISFSRIVNAVSNSASVASVNQSTPYYFPQSVSGQIAGHAIYDALTGGNLVATIPYAVAVSLPSQGDRGDVGSLTFTVPAGNYYAPDALNTVIQAFSLIGLTPDGSSVFTGNAALWVQHGNGMPFYGSADVTTRTVTEVTAFSLTPPIGVSAVDIKGAGTLAAGALVLPTPQTDGFLFRLSCSVTVTALTVTATTPATIVGTAPATCGPNAGHQLQYFLADTSWHVEF
jgi:hypothetical protein